MKEAYDAIKAVSGSGTLLSLQQNTAQSVKKSEQAQAAREEHAAGVKSLIEQTCRGLSTDQCSAKFQANRLLLEDLTLGMIPIIGDIKSFGDAETLGDYGWAVVGALGGPLGDTAKALRTGSKTVDALHDVANIEKAADKVAEAERAAATVSKVPRPGTLDDLTGAAQAAASRSGNLCKSKVCEYGVEIATHADDQALVSKIAAGADKGGALTEQLAENIAKRSGYESLAAKYGSNNGFDHVLIKTMDDGSVMILDSKQMDNFTTKLRKGAGGEVQLSNGWIDAVIKNLKESGKGTDAINAISTARESGKLTTAVIAVDKATQKVIAVPVKVGS